MHFNSTTAPIDFASLSDLVTTGDGAIKVVSRTGSILVRDGDGDSIGVQATGRGDVLLQTDAVDGDIVVSASIRSGSGHLSVRASDDIVLNASMRTGASVAPVQIGTVFLFAGNQTVDAVSGVVMQSGVAVTTSNGNIRVAADNEGDVRLGLLDAGTRSVSVAAEGSILNNTLGLNIIAADLRLWADAAIQPSGSHDAAVLVGNASARSAQTMQPTARLM